MGAQMHRSCLNEDFGSEDSSLIRSELVSKESLRVLQNQKRYYGSAILQAMMDEDNIESVDDINSELSSLFSTQSFSPSKIKAEVSKYQRQYQTEKKYGFDKICLKHEACFFEIPHVSSKDSANSNKVSESSVPSLRQKYAIMDSIHYNSPASRASKSVIDQDSYSYTKSANLSIDNISPFPSDEFNERNSPLLQRSSIKDLRINFGKASDLSVDGNDAIAFNECIRAGDVAALDNMLSNKSQNIRHITVKYTGSSSFLYNKPLAVQFLGKEDNKISSQTFPLLHLAVLNNQPEVAKYIIDHGGDIMARDEDGRTALYLAYQRYKTIAKTARNDDDYSDSVCDNIRMIKVLTESKANHMQSLDEPLSASKFCSSHSISSDWSKSLSPLQRLSSHPATSNLSALVPEAIVESNAYQESYAQSLSPVSLWAPAKAHSPTVDYHKVYSIKKYCSNSPILYPRNLRLSNEDNNIKTECSTVIQTASVDRIDSSSSKRVHALVSDRAARRRELHGRKVPSLSPKFSLNLNTKQIEDLPSASVNLLPSASVAVAQSPALSMHLNPLRHYGNGHGNALYSPELKWDNLHQHGGSRKSSDDGKETSRTGRYSYASALNGTGWDDGSGSNSGYKPREAKEKKILRKGRKLAAKVNKVSVKMYHSIFKTLKTPEGDEGGSNNRTVTQTNK